MSAAFAHAETEMPQSAAHAPSQENDLPRTRIYAVPLRETTDSDGAAPSLPASEPPLDAPAFRAREYRPFAAFEYDVTNVGRHGRTVFASMWKHALRVCEEQNGYVVEYHAGHKRPGIAGPVGAIREFAYATCAIEPAPEVAPSEATPAPVIEMLGKARGGSDEDELVVVSGMGKRQAYEAARDLAYRTCVDRDRRVDRMSVGFKDNRRERVRIRFACSTHAFGAWQG
ncbi:hypothetical protein [Luteibacter yeojuensis]|nr:hypothetical protein [Luteibacter yeojuensis]